ncbi:MAG: hypothetical protein ACE5EZ_03900, partial [Thermodesulfobacteriota bacterium]
MAKNNKPLTRKIFTLSLSLILTLLLSSLLFTTAATAGEDARVKGLKESNETMVQRGKAYYYYMTGHMLKENGYTKDA